MNGDARIETELYATLAGRIDDDLTRRLLDRLSHAVTNGVQRLHLMVNSTGGIIGNGFAIHNYLKNLPIDVITYNPGTVQSIAVILFLAAQKRKASSTATFMIHKATFYASTPATSADLYSATRSLDVDDTRIEGVLKSCIRMPEDKWNVHRFADLFITAPEAVEYGLIDEIADFAPPAGATLINI